MNMILCDIAIIGGGIIGTGIARELSRYNVNTILIEKNMDIASGTTKGNGGVTHSGYDAKYGTLKGKLNAKGAVQYKELSKELEFEYLPCGTLTIGFNEEEHLVLKELLENGIKNKVPGVRIIEGEEIFKVEPKANPKAKYALHAPSAGVVDPYEVAIAFAENAATNGVEFYRNNKVLDIEKDGDDFIIITERNRFRAKCVINATGVYGSVIANMVGIHDYRVMPRWGELLIVDKQIGFELSSVLFPVPGKATKGIAAIPACAGNIIIGSTAVMIEDRDYVGVTKEGIETLLHAAQKLVPEISSKFVIREFSGLRPVAMDNNNDFIIEAHDEVKNFINVIGIQSPGVGAAPAIAQYVVDIVRESGFELVEKTHFIKERKKITRFKNLDMGIKNSMIMMNHDYGQIVCRCESITRAEVIDAIRRPVGAVTVDGVKRRTRAGMGRCQSAFCQPRIVEILSEELHIPQEEVLLENEGSNILVGRR